MEPTRFTVLPTSEARIELSAAASRFRVEGLLAKPIIFGSHRKPEGAIISVELFEQLLPEIENLQIAEILKTRIQDGLPRIPFENLVAQVGFKQSDIK